MQVKVSIIMPVYNGEKYVRQAVESIIAQKETSWECIVIDDGSTDSTAEILDEFREREDRIKVYHRENHGVSVSRQFGIEKAQGKYCIHVDADDWVESDYLSQLVAKAEESDADMVWCDAFVNEYSVWSMPCEEEPDEMIRQILLQKYWGTLWNRLIRTAICQSKEVSFPASSMWEDMGFVIQCLLKCSKIVYLAKPLYHYRQVETSLTHIQSQKNISKEYRAVVDTLQQCFLQHGVLSKFIYELRSLQLFAIRDFIDDIRFRDYERFVKTYPDAMAHIWEYKDYPIRLKVCAWLIRRNLSTFVPVVCKIDAVLRRLGITKQS